MSGQETAWLVDVVACEATVSFDAGAVSARTQRNPDKTTESNEDSAVVIPCAGERLVIAVADGVGGAPAGQEASRLTLQILEEKTRKAKGLQEAVLAAFESANAALLDRRTGTATTLCVATIERNRVKTYHAGDSQALVVGQRGRIKYETISHSPVGYAVESGMLEEDDALTHEDRHMISNVVGHKEMRIEIGAPVDLARWDTLVLASDGILDNVTQAELVEFARRGPLHRQTGRLVQECIRRMSGQAGNELSKPDDATVILYRRSM